MGFSLRAEETKKKPSVQTKSGDSVHAAKKVWDSVEGIKSEFGKITWTSREELQTYTKIVVGATFFLGLAVYVVDLSIQAMISFSSLIVRALIG